MATKKKSFAADLDPAMAILQKETPVKEKSGKQPHRLTYNTPERESYSKRVQLLVKPSVYAILKEDADAEGASLNAYVNLIFEDYIKRRNAD